MTEKVYRINENMKKYNILNCYKIESLLTIFEIIEQCGEHWDELEPIAIASHGNFIIDKPLYIIVGSSCYSLSELCLTQIRQINAKLKQAQNCTHVYEIEEFNLKGGL